MAPTISTSKDNYINYPQAFDNKLDGHLWLRNSEQQLQQQQAKPSAALRTFGGGDFGPDRIILPPSYMNTPSQRQGFALPNNDEVTYANLK